MLSAQRMNDDAGENVSEAGATAVRRNPTGVAEREMARIRHTVDSEEMHLRVRERALDRLEQASVGSGRSNDVSSTSLRSAGLSDWQRATVARSALSLLRQLADALHRLNAEYESVIALMQQRLELAGHGVGSEDKAEADTEAAAQSLLRQLQRLQLEARQHRQQRDALAQTWRRLRHAASALAPLRERLTATQDEVHTLREQIRELEAQLAEARSTVDMYDTRFDHVEQWLASEEQQRDSLRRMREERTQQLEEARADVAAKARLVSLMEAQGQARARHDPVRRAEKEVDDPSASSLPLLNRPASYSLHHPPDGPDIAPDGESEEGIRERSQAESEPSPPPPPPAYDDAVRRSVDSDSACTARSPLTRLRHLQDAQQQQRQHPPHVLQHLSPRRLHAPNLTRMHGTTKQELIISGEPYNNRVLTATVIGWASTPATPTSPRTPAAAADIAAAAPTIQWYRLSRHSDAISPYAYRCQHTRYHTTADDVGMRLVALAALSPTLTLRAFTEALQVAPEMEDRLATWMLDGRAAFLVEDEATGIPRAIVVSKKNLKIQRLATAAGMQVMATQAHWLQQQQQRPAWTDPTAAADATVRHSRLEASSSTRRRRHSPPTDHDSTMQAGSTLINDAYDDTFDWRRGHWITEEKKPWLPHFKATLDDNDPRAFSVTLDHTFVFRAAGPEQRDLIVLCIRRFAARYRLGSHAPRHECRMQ
ncbi:hypothetical protein CDCA_CDCA19G4690 [Cyanidium caldarium]|uniref:Uncharacterized protein n=1 Tax=Cyanidium caldarium TaxID=2771 RepID=A0AAV9J2W4_CYACA|nr:hypothetical protein CDCA_CDCA19G4690 [Cyanidium caldarium]